MLNRYKTRGVCSREIIFEVKDGVLTHVEIIGGCAGNAAGVARLAMNRNVDEVIGLLKGIPCRGGTSCPDQLATALMQYQAKN